MDQLSHLNSRSHRYWHWIFWSAALALVAIGVRYLSPVLSPVAAAFLISYLLNPIVSLLEQKLKIARWLSTLILFLIGIGLAAIAGFLLVPMLVYQVRSFLEGIPPYLERIDAEFIPWLELRFGLQVPARTSEIFNEFTERFQSLGAADLKSAGQYAGFLAQRTIGFVAAFVTLLLVPVFAFYFLLKYDELLRGAEELVPLRYRQRIHQIAVEINGVLASWIRGQLIVVAVLSILYSAALSLIGVKLALAIGVITGLLSFIPYVGVTTGVTISLAMCLADGQGWAQILKVCIVFISINFIENFALTPKLVGDKVGLGPVGVLLALMLGAHLFGFVGVLLSVPTAAVAVVLIRHLLDVYKHTSFFTRETNS